MPCKRLILTHAGKGSLRKGNSMCKSFRNAKMWLRSEEAKERWGKAAKAISGGASTDQLRNLDFILKRKGTLEAAVILSS